jgi:hypothetical protein
MQPPQKSHPSHVHLADRVAVGQGKALEDRIGECISGVRAAIFNSR